MRKLRPLLLSALLGALAFGLLASAPPRAEAYFGRYGPYGRYYAPYYWSPRAYIEPRYYYGPYSYGWYSGTNYPYPNRYYYWYRTYPWWY
jgi:hypothetical protein